MLFLFVTSVPRAWDDFCKKRLQGTHSDILKFVSSTAYTPHMICVYLSESIQVFEFCRSKCHRNFNRKRNPRKAKWTKSFRKTNGKEMTVDSTFEFEKRRNRPIRYNRETMAQTLNAMKRVSEIQHKRQDLFFKMRMRAHKGTQRERVRAVIEKGIEILAPAAANKEKALELATAKYAEKDAKSKASKKVSKSKEVAMEE